MPTLLPYEPQFALPNAQQPNLAQYPPGSAEEMLSKYLRLNAAPPMVGSAYDPVNSRQPGDALTPFQQEMAKRQALATLFQGPSAYQALQAGIAGAGAQGRLDYVNHNVQPVTPYTPFTPTAAPVHAPVELPNLQAPHADPTATLLAAVMGLAAPVAGAGFMSAAKQGEMAGSQMANSRALQNYELQRGQSETGYQDALRQWMSQNSAGQANTAGANEVNRSQDARNMQVLGMNAPEAGIVASSGAAVPAYQGMAGKESAIAKAQSDADMAQMLIKYGYETGNQNNKNATVNAETYPRNVAAVGGLLLGGREADVKQVGDQNKTALSLAELHNSLAMHRANLGIEQQKVRIEGRRADSYQQQVTNTGAYHVRLADIRQQAIDNRHADLMAKNPQIRDDGQYKALFLQSQAASAKAKAEHSSVMQTPESLAFADAAERSAQDALTAYAQKYYAHPTAGAKPNLPVLPGFKQGAKKTPGGVTYSISP